MSLDESKFRHNMNMNDINVSQARIDRIAQIDKQVVNLLDYISEGIAVEDIEKNAIDYGKNNHEITLLTQKYFQVSDLYKMLIEKKKAKKHTILINMCFY